MPSNLDQRPTGQAQLMVQLEVLAAAAAATNANPWSLAAACDRHAARCTVCQARLQDGSGGVPSANPASSPEAASSSHQQHHHHQQQLQCSSQGERSTSGRPSAAPPSQMPEPSPLSLHLQPGSTGASLLDWHLWPADPPGSSSSCSGVAWRGGGDPYSETSFASDVSHLKAWLLDCKPL
jgi:hypothetical protein